MTERTYEIWIGEHDWLGFQIIAIRDDISNKAEYFISGTRDIEKRGQIVITGDTELVPDESFDLLG